ncbi:MAG: stage III sporulation protein AA [Lachnospiraceae bacterium]|nr:stage III sporulation protein AA [Lachnospiraceae bacterium]
MKDYQMEEILHVLPVRLRVSAEQELRGNRQIQEIRLRCGKPVKLLENGRERMMQGSTVLTAGDMQETMEFVSRFSMYAYEEEIRQGFLTIRGGHRVGIAGKAVLSQGQIRTIRNISFIHIRIACQYRDCALGLLPYLYENGRLRSTLIFSAPGQGKTTLMRDLIRLVSDGNAFGLPETVAVVDERGELAACDQGVPQNDLGAQTDVLDGCPKTLGMRLMLRSMAPSVLAVDEIAEGSDVDAVFKAAGCGCVLLATAHGESMDRLLEKEGFRRLKQARVFDRYIQLENEGAPGKWSHIYNGEGGKLL